LSEAHDSAAAAGEDALARIVLLDREFVRLQTQPEGALAGLVQATDDAYLVFSESENHLGLANVWRLRAELHWMACSYGATSHALEHAIDHAQRAHETREEAAVAVWLASCLALGPTPVTEAVARCDGLLDLVNGSRRVEAAVFTVLGYLHALGGQADLTRNYLAEAKRRYEELGLTVARAQWSVFAGMALLHIDAAEAAEAELRWSYETLRDLGERSSMPTAAAYLARVLVAQGRFDEADEMTRESERFAAADDLASQIAWRGARAQCRAEAGDTAAAETLAQAALSLAEGTDDLELTGFAQSTLATALRAAGDADGAERARQAAVAAYEAKGHVLPTRGEDSAVATD
ncbi:MAG: hypothetical protein ACRDVZ_11320, partial [Jiangellaceae bacterium]